MSNGTFFYLIFMVKYVCIINQAGRTPLKKKKVLRIKGPCPPHTSKALLVY
jgi:hypothetical protein